MSARTKLIIALLIPILGLLALTLYKRNIYHNGKEVILDIEGYDPRDLLSGHYIRYTVKYGVDNICPDKYYVESAYLCLDPKGFSDSEPSNCKTMLKGRCDYNKAFAAGIERFYIPESRAKELEDKVRDKHAQIIVGVMPSGEAVVKDLLIDGQKWSE